MNLISIFKTPIIEFFCDARYFGVAPNPCPAGKNIPEWFKQIPPVSKTNRDAYSRPSLNAKKCLPMIDAMTIGFTMPLAISQHIKTNHDLSRIEVCPTSTSFDRAVERHSLEQVGNAEVFGKADPVKFINPWVVKTSPGWSTLFIPPVNSEEDRFICLGGLVDTDKYPKQVNFPARWLKPNFDDTLVAGTPLVTAIPIKRQNIDHIVRQMTDVDGKEIDRIRRCQDSRSHYYTQELRCPR
jgi:hypothetical protein